MAGAGKSVGRHVQRMRCVWGNLRITPSGPKRSRCQRRYVIGVDDVVSEARMFRLLRKQCFENSARLEPAGVSLIRWLFGGGKSERVENLRLVVFRIFRRHLFHGIAIGKQTLALRRALKVAI